MPKAKLAAEAKAKLAPRDKLKEVEGTVEATVKAFVAAAQIAGDTKHAAATALPAKKPDDFMSTESAAAG